VTLSSGETVSFDILVVATGLRPRTFRLAEPSGTVHVLRTIDDAERLNAALQAAGSLTVVGAGFLGLEVASTASQLGVEVTVVEPQTRPLGAILDPSMADRIAGFFADTGVRLRLGCGASSIAPGSSTEDPVVTTLTDGSTLTSDHVVLALGAAPALDWLANSGVPTGDGVLCDAHLQAAESVFAAGDIANWQDSVTGQRTRIEHRTNAVEQAAVVAHNIVCQPGDELSYTPLPYVWSDQLGHRVQIFGRPRSSDEVINANTDLAKPITIHCREGHIVGVIGLDNAKEVRRYAQLVGQPDLHARTGDAAPQEVEAR
jgi:NADPH-dependent 2,4-dienoyl-CoA reductase/sulfur reductase-like enzyme